MYLTYEEYKLYGGTADETTYNSIIYEAQACVDYATFNRLKNEVEIPVEVKVCLTNIINLVNRKYKLLLAQNEDDKEVMSMSNDGVSVSYNTVSANDVISKVDYQIKQTIQLFLSGVKNSEGKLLTYRGLYPNE